MARKLVISAAVIGALLVAGYVGFRAYRGPVGATEALVVPEFSSLDPARWRNGAPQSLVASRGEVVFLEGWSPT
jgi:hypothetical protein